MTPSRVELEDGHAHLDAERFGFLRAGGDAAVVVGEDDDGAAEQVGSKTRSQLT